MTTHAVNVVVVGAGPTGLTAAGDLARTGRSVTVLQRWPTINPSSRAFATMARTLEVLDARGVAEDLLARSHHAPGVTIFGGARIDLTHLDSPYRFAMITPQTNVDRALADYAIAHGADIQRGIEVIGLEQDTDGVTVIARPEDGGPGDLVRWRAQYLIGADGAHSTVRALVGADFPGRTMLSSIVLADVKLADGPAGGALTLGSTRNEFAFLAPYDDRDASGAWYRAMVWDRNNQLPDDAPVKRDEIADILARAMDPDPGLLEVGWKSRFHCDERQVEQYRHGRVFLAGDAAHVHSPMGGQGMNTGIQDAANLAWKIDAVLAGAGDSVLDTYHDERHPIGKRVLLQSGLMARGITLRPPVARGLRNMLAPRLLRIPRVRDAIAGSFAGTTLRYATRKGESPLVGTRATQIPLRHGQIGKLLRLPGFVFVRERGAPCIDAAGLPQAERTDDGPAVLVRPDGYIAWAGNSADRAAGAEALGWWTGRKPLCLVTP
ncbi:FAD-dependent monooxygenase [Mycobacterium montefiorense]|uniref:FAD-dependent oxidoreductase n=1 Tax=Mycobacterium montefiorense TaxID=154654 RepID=A0AA37UTL9_9MYCO|nr:FAD-dependent monooxygenase [Mycobacterium montefiorense]GBG37674.1 FAD-dependent oxidoreductase [Mycobacterium montefiorense]GKU34811.1 FAD-dependent oxidoreductase [Mycobacterium montefiorense]GKU40825.1 FAD-dependent oxidoreductase [Mycobacterium montefiorense]GKU46932.1 FAD-dependent oxidoreductase [Mycobacterium montefiorense]GKU49052.1 FAD-dependent oxidoreductase [Mycobacterium montefiorense]